MNERDVRRVLLEVVAEVDAEPSLSLQTATVLKETKRKLAGDTRLPLEEERLLLTVWYDLFRTGLLAWGHNLQNPNPPFLHTTDVGRRALSQISRDPYNPDGYLESLRPGIEPFPIAETYMAEGVAAFVNGLFRAAAVLVGAATESVILAVRDELVDRITAGGKAVDPTLEDWRVKTVRDAIDSHLVPRKQDMGRKLWERYTAFFVAMSDQIRITRNDAGHPKSIDPITEPTVHGNLLLIPEFVQLASELRGWIGSEY